MDKAPLCACGCGHAVIWSKYEKRWNNFIHGHNAGPHVVKPETEAPYCACGCGNKVSWNFSHRCWPTYLPHHWPKTCSIPTPPTEDAPLCACGCGRQVAWSPYRHRWNTYCQNHSSSKAKRRPKSPAPWCACGCEQPVKWNRRHGTWSRFVRGHSSRTEANRQLSSQLRKNSKNPEKYTYANCDYCGEKKRISPGMLKKHRNFFCGRDCKVKYYTGENCPLYKHGKSPLPYGGNTWKKQRKKALKRDSYTCRYCGKKPHKKRLLHVHHIIALETFNGNFEEAHKLTNLITLCCKCHSRAEMGTIVVQPLLL